MVKLGLITTNEIRFPVFVSILLIALAGLGIFVVGFDQGQIFSIFLGQQAYADQYLHELSHDLRHAAGFPCH